MRTVTVGAYLVLSVAFSGCTHKREYPREVRQNFLSACVNGDNRKQPSCKCLLDKYQQRYTYEQFLMIDDWLRHGVPPDDNYKEWFQAATLTCTGQ